MRTQPVRSGRRSPIAPYLTFPLKRGKEQSISLSPSLLSLPCDAGEGREGADRVSAASRRVSARVLGSFDSGFPLPIPVLRLLTLRALNESIRFSDRAFHVLDERGGLAFDGGQFFAQATDRLRVQIVLEH